MTQPPMTPPCPGWYEDQQDPTLLRYFDGVIWTANTTPRRSPTADASVIGRATPGVIPGTAAGHGHSGSQGPGEWQGGGVPPAGYNPYTQGWTAPRRDALPDGAVLAEWWRRLVGRLIDGFIVLAAITLVIAFPSREPGHVDHVGLLRQDPPGGRDRCRPAEPDGVRGRTSPRSSSRSP